MGLGVVVGITPVILKYRSAAVQNKLDYKDYIVSGVSGLIFGLMGLAIIRRKETGEVEERDIPIAICPAHQTFS